MKAETNFFIFLIIISFQSSLLAFNPVILTDSQGEYPLGIHMEILEDQERMFGIEEVSSREFYGKFVKNDRENPNFGYTDSALWVRFNVINNSTREEWLIELEDPLLDRIQLFIPYKDKNSRKTGFRVKEAGDIFPFSQREVNHQNHVFSLPIEPSASRTFYLKITGEESIQLPLTIFSPSAFSVSDRKKRMMHGLYYGIMLAMFLYNLLLFFSLRDRNYLYYILYIANYILLQLSMNGLAYEYLWPSFPLLNRISIPFLAASLILILSVFSRNFLMTKVNALTIDKLFLVIIGFSGLEIILSLVPKYNITLKINAVLGIAYTFFALTAGLVIWRKGYRPAKYYVTAWLLFMAGTSLYILRDFGLVPSVPVTTNSMQIGSAIEAILISLALADRINIMKQEKEEAQALAIQNLKKTDMLNEHLAGLMKDFSRLTAKIHNSLKNKLDSLQNFLSHSIKVYDNKEKLMENLLIAKNLVYHCSAESKNILFVTTHKECSIAQFMDELELQAGLALSGMRIKYSIQRNSLPLERILKLETILNILDAYSEILNNIVKHSEATAVVISLKYENEYMILSINDNGLGFDYRGQREKKGSYGLNMLEELVQEIGAELEIQSKPGHGSMISISARI